MRAMTHNFPCRIRRDGKWLTITPVGYLNDQGGAAMNDTIQNTDITGVELVLFDFGECTLANSQGIASILDHCDRFSEQCHLKIAFCRMSPLLKEAFSLVGLMDMVSAFGTEQEARSALSHG